ncbi:ATP-binding protein [Jeotgalibacillus haloalkalitolerans]|uniref:MoxR family ATPase n=1 Tax=Jeotgalibacillus haloalkalitolerans TaxID=3104292 RepID=A0ABU5KKV5_9BACL|nr:MoxR family ATPase [Jeotgalibacillus sp. HH7-29]MDZ5711897.1 MoxR family ATPase [Jeotgalibacillus sp. HH7-29]
MELSKLPENIRQLIEQSSKGDADSQGRIGSGGYTADDPSVFHDVMIGLSLQKNILLKGPTGSGKTKLAESVSYTFNQPMYSINCSVDLDAEAMLGFKTIEQVDGKSAITFVEGPVIQAMKKGHILYIDEINMAKPETLPILNGVLDYRRTITNPFTNEVITAAEGFKVVAAINEGYIGTVPLNEALKNRFIVVDVPYIKGDTLKTVLMEQSALKDERIIDQFVELSADLFTQVQNGQVSEEAASIRALLDTCDLSIYMPPKRAIQRGIIDKLEDEREKSAVKNIADTIFE